MSRIIELNEKPYYKVERLKVWTGEPTDMSWTWVYYYVSASDLLNGLLDHEIIHYDDVVDYIAVLNGLTVLDGDADPEDLEKFQSQIYEYERNMTDSEIEDMISTFTGNAYYQTFEDVYKENEEDQ